MTMTGKIYPNKKAFIRVLLFLASVMISCTFSQVFSEKNSSKFPDDSRVDRSFVTGRPCDAPCWHGLTIGESTVDDIREILSELPFADSSQIHEQSTGNFGPNEKLFIIPCVYSKDSESCAELETGPDGKLRRIILYVDYELSLQSVTQQLGDPKYYTANPSPGKDICFLEIYWPERNIVAAVEETPKTKHCSTVKNEQIDLRLHVVSLVYMEINTQHQQNLEAVPWQNSTP